MLKLSASRSRELLSQPESGMGYQVVELEFFGGRREKAVAYNAELMVLASEAPFGGVMLTRESYRSMLEGASSSDASIKSIRVLPRERAIALSATESAKRSLSAKAGSAQGAATEKTKEDEIFKRFSAYANDRRVAADNSFLPGTYATTEEDAKHVKTGAEAVARYALPNSAPASNVFTCKPKKDTDIQHGTVQPANSQPGGGVEVIFPNGTQANTVTGPDKIPDN